MREVFQGGDESCICLISAIDLHPTHFSWALLLAGWPPRKNNGTAGLLSCSRNFNQNFQHSVPSNLEITPRGFFTQLQKLHRHPRSGIHWTPKKSSPSTLGIRMDIRLLVDGSYVFEMKPLLTMQPHIPKLTNAR